CAASRGTRAWGGEGSVDREAIATSPALDDELGLEEACDVVEDARRFGNVRVGGGAHRFEPHVAETIDRVLEREAELEGETERPAETLDQAGERGPLLGDLDEDLAGTAIFEEADGEVALVPPDAELVRHRSTGRAQD